jgi:hypothetical protein
MDLTPEIQRSDFIPVIFSSTMSAGTTRQLRSGTKRKEPEQSREQQSVEAPPPVPPVKRRKIESPDEQRRGETDRDPPFALNMVVFNQTIGELDQFLFRWRLNLSPSAPPILVQWKDVIYDVESELDEANLIPFGKRDEWLAHMDDVNSGSTSSYRSWTLTTTRTFTLKRMRTRGLGHGSRSARRTSDIPLL